MKPRTRIADLLATLVRHDVQFIVVGGVAAIVQGAPITTFDLDVVYARTPENLANLERALEDARVSCRHPRGV